MLGQNSSQEGMNSDQGDEKQNNSNYALKSEQTFKMYKPVTAKGVGSNRRKAHQKLQQQTADGGKSGPRMQGW